jgi:hypothetical protein
MKSQTITRGVIHATKEPCAICGGHAMYQEWAEPDNTGRLKRYGMIFCQECSNQTKIHSERTAQETKFECEYEWKARNSFFKDKKNNEAKSL